MALRKIAKGIAFDTGAGTGTKQTTVLNPDDLSRCIALELRAIFTKTVTDTVDVCTVRLQCTWDGGLTWEDRIAVSMLGDAGASTSVPKHAQGVVQQQGGLSDTEEASKPAALTAPAVLNGAFPAPYRLANVVVGQPVRQSAWRVVIEVTDADNDADFEGTIEIWADNPAY